MGAVFLFGVRSTTNPSLVLFFFFSVLPFARLLFSFGFGFFLRRISPQSCPRHPPQTSPRCRSAAPSKYRSTSNSSSPVFTTITSLTPDPRIPSPPLRPSTTLSPWARLRLSSSLLFAAAFPLNGSIIHPSSRRVAPFRPTTTLISRRRVDPLPWAISLNPPPRSPRRRPPKTMKRRLYPLLS